MTESAEQPSELANPASRDSDKIEKSVREVAPFTLDYSGDPNVVDFRPIPVDANTEDVDPKDSSAAEPADSSSSETKTPEEPSSENPVKTAAPTVAKGNTPPKVSRSGTQTS